MLSGSTKSQAEQQVTGYWDRSEVVTKSCHSEGHPENQKETIRKPFAYLTTYKFKARAKKKTVHKQNRMTDNLQKCYSFNIHNAHICQEEQVKRPATQSVGSVGHRPGALASPGAD